MRKIVFLLALSLYSFLSIAQATASSTILHHVHQLQNPLRVLYLAAHPDDENTRMISWLANDIGAQTAYLSLTRGDGGQNLIGTELGAELGILRTQELMQARNLDGGQQFFSRAVDFGYSKNPEETFEHWDKEQVLSDVVRVIRYFRPHIIITRFPPDSRAGHGHHTASAMLALEAFEKAADPKAFKETNLEAWQVSRVFWNHSSWWEPKLDSIAANDPTYYVVDVGSYVPELGLSCNELASYSRSQHKSQGFGVAVDRGSQKEYLKLMKGEAPESSIFAGLPMNWTDYGYPDIAEGLAAIEANFDPQAPHKSLEAILDLHAKLRMNAGKRILESRYLVDQLNHLAAECIGLKLEVLAENEYVVGGEKPKYTARAIQRSPLPIQIEKLSEWKLEYKAKTGPVDLVTNVLMEAPLQGEILDDEMISSQPYWLRAPYKDMFSTPVADWQLKPETAPYGGAHVAIYYKDKAFSLYVPVRYKFSDRVDGEIERPIMIVPELTVKSNTAKLFFLDDQAQELNLDFRAFKAGKYSISLMTEGWEISPSSFVLNFEAKGDWQTQKLSIKPKMGAGPTSLIVLQQKKMGDETQLTPLQNLVEIDYPHIDKRMVLENPGISLFPLNLKKIGEKVAYIVGAGDKVPEALVQMGYEVTILDEHSMRETDLSQFQAVLLGIRAYNTQDWLWQRQEQLMDYVKAGGNVIVQYNTRSRSFQGTDFAPYPFTISRERVTEEKAEVRFTDMDHPLLNRPNKIVKADFDNWVQERGLYFADSWDEAYTTPLAWHDKGEPDRLGGLLIANYGQGAFMYTGISFFRELPAGVSGAYRLLANMISYETGNP